MKRPLVLMSLVYCLLAVTLPLSAQTPPTLVPADAKFAVVLNPSKLLQSQMGQRALSFIRREHPQIDEIIDEMSETVGIDLRTSLGRTILFGTGYDQKDFALVADIGPTSGNLNGLLLTAPEYESDVYRESVIVHSLLTDDPHHGPQRVYCATPKRPGTGSFYLVASFDPQRTRTMIDQTMDADARLMHDGADDELLVELWFNSLPELAQRAQAQGPPSAVVELVQKGHFALREEADSMNANLSLTMVDPLRAQQVFELLRGGVAVMQLAAAAEPQAQPLGEFSQMINVQHAPDSAEVTASFSSGYTKLEELISRLDGMKHHHGPPPSAPPPPGPPPAPGAPPAPGPSPAPAPGM